MFHVLGDPVEVQTETARVWELSTVPWDMRGRAGGNAWRINGTLLEGCPTWSYITVSRVMIGMLAPLLWALKSCYPYPYSTCDVKGVK